MNVKLRIEIASGVPQEHCAGKVPREPKRLFVARAAAALADCSEMLHRRASPVPIRRILRAPARRCRLSPARSPPSAPKPECRKVPSGFSCSRATSAACQSASRDSRAAPRTAHPLRHLQDRASAATICFFRSTAIRRRRLLVLRCDGFEWRETLRPARALSVSETQTTEIDVGHLLRFQ